MNRLRVIFVVLALARRPRVCWCHNNFRGRSNIFEEKAHFRLTIVSTLVEQHNGAVATEEEIQCIPIIDGKETDELYRIELSQDFIKENRAAIEQEQGQVVLSPKSKKKVVLNPQVRKRSSEKKSRTTGVKSIAIVRISTRDAAPKEDAWTLVDGMFNPAKVNLKTQFRACSAGKLDWQLAQAGVVEVFVDQPISNFTTGFSLVTAAQKTLFDQHGIQASSLGDKVMMCLPPGTGNWLAVSGINHWRAYFNSEWCLSLTANMHELAHTLGLNHAFERGIDYGDSTGYMAAGHKDSDWPRKCFNGRKNWELGWYSDRQVTLLHSFDTGHEIKLATFVDYETTTSDEPVLVNIANELFLQYNRAKGFNVDTEEKKDEITITAATDAGSEALAGLSIGQRYNIENFKNSTHTLVIEACQAQMGSFGAETVLISVAYNKTLCERRNPESWDYFYEQLQSTPEGAPAPAAPVGRFGFWALFRRGFDAQQYTPKQISTLAKWIHEQRADP